MISLLSFQAYFSVFSVFVLTLKTLLKRGSVAPRTVRVPFCNVVSHFAEWGLDLFEPLVQQ